MASLYNYTDFENRMNQLGLNGQISQADLDLAKKNPDAGIKLLEAKRDWNTATDDIGRKAANTKAEKIRSTYGGYTGGTAGAEWNINAPKTPSSFSSDYDDIIQSEIKRYQDKTFEYDANSDPLYSQYKKTYAREGRRASEDTMAQAAAMTGGIPSSYAIQAGQQAGNYYASQVADKIPELENLAYNRYLNDKDDAYRRIALLRAERDSAYNRHMDDINYDLTQLELERQAERDKISDERYDAERKETLRAQALSEAYNAATVGDWSKLKALGVTPDPIMVDAYGEDQAYNRLLQDIEIANNYAQLGDFSKWEELGAVPDYAYMDSKNKDSSADASTDILSEVQYKYDNMIVPDNIMASYDTRSPGAKEQLLALGFMMSPSSAKIAELEKQYPDGVISALKWRELLDEGYAEEELISAGFSKGFTKQEAKTKLPQNSIIDLFK